MLFEIVLKYLDKTGYAGKLNWNLFVHFCNFWFDRREMHMTYIVAGFVSDDSLKAKQNYE